MNSIDSNVERELAAFFENSLSPAAEALRKRGVVFFEDGFRKEADTYFFKRSDDEKYVQQIDLERLSEQLASLWQDIPELLAITDSLEEFSRQLEARESESGGDVSPFIYAMF